MPRIRQFRAEDILNIELRETDLENLEGLNLQKHGEQLALTPEAKTLLTDDGEIIACLGGFVYGRACLVFLLTSPLVEAYPLLLVRVVKAFFTYGIHHGVVRFETLMNPHDARAIHWIEHLGFEREGLCRATGENLKDRYLYARIEKKTLMQQEG